MKRPPPDWPASLRHALSDYGIALSDPLPSGGSVGFRISGGEQGVDVELGPYDGNAAYFAHTRRFGISYRGIERLGESQKNLLLLFGRVLAGIEAGFPDDLGLSGNPLPDGESDSLPRGINRRFFFCTAEESRVLPDSGSVSYEAMVRLTSGCSQSCPFCSGEKLQRNPEPDEIDRCLYYLDRTLPRFMVTLTGGEPTLSPHFFAALSRAFGLEHATGVQVQTNACAFADPAFAARLPGPEKIGFFVSLHALDEAVYDACTGTRGLFPRAVSGIDRLLAAGAAVTLNCVVSSLNIAHLADYARECAARFDGPAKPELHFSTLICSRFNADAARYLVSYSEVARVFEEIERGPERGRLMMLPFLSSTHASIPPCFLREDLRRNRSVAFDAKGEDTGYGDLSRRWVKAPACRRCAADGLCLGVPNEYARRFGLDELTPVA